MRDPTYDWSRIDPQMLKSPFHRNLQRLMREQGHTSESLARRMGISSRGIREWFSRGVVPHVATYYRLARALGVTMEELWKEAA